MIFLKREIGIAVPFEGSLVVAPADAPRLRDIAASSERREPGRYRCSAETPMCQAWRRRLRKPIAAKPTPNNPIEVGSGTFADGSDGEP